MCFRTLHVRFLCSQLHRQESTFVANDDGVARLSAVVARLGPSSRALLGDRERLRRPFRTVSLARPVSNQIFRQTEPLRRQHRRRERARDGAPRQPTLKQQQRRPSLVGPPRPRPRDALQRAPRALHAAKQRELARSRPTRVADVGALAHAAHAHARGGVRAPPVVHVQGAHARVPYAPLDGVGGRAIRSTRALGHRAGVGRGRVCGRRAFERLLMSSREEWVVGRYFSRADAFDVA